MKLLETVASAAQLTLYAMASLALFSMAVLISAAGILVLSAWLFLRWLFNPPLGEN